MKTQLVGYADERGEGKPILVAGPEVSRDDQMKIWVAAKVNHKFPKGVVRLDLEDRIDNATAIFISDDVANETEAFANAEATRVKAAKEKKQAEAKIASDLKAAQRAISDTAVARNQANHEFNTAKQSNDDAQSNFAANPDLKPFKDRAAKAQDRLDKSKAAFDAADKAWLDAKAALGALQNLPKTEAK